MELSLEFEPKAHHPTTTKDTLHYHIHAYSQIISKTLFSDQSIDDLTIKF